MFSFPLSSNSFINLKLKPYRLGKALSAPRTQSGAISSSRLPAVSGKNNQTITGAISERVQTTAIEVQLDPKIGYSSDTALSPSMPAAVATIARKPVAVERYRVGNSSVP